MEINDPGNWNIADPCPGASLESIGRVGTRAVALLARRKTHPALQGEFVRVFGAVDMLGALDYHFDRLVQIRSELEPHVQALLRCRAGGEPPSSTTSHEQDLQRFAKYEVASYVCRLGQFFYFAGSDFVVQRIGARPSMPTIERLLIFRHKFAAHRSLDHPKSGETAELQVLHAFSLSCSGTSWRPMRGGALGFSFQIRKDAGEVEDFVPDEDHPAVMKDAFGVLESVLNQAAFEQERR